MTVVTSAHRVQFYSAQDPLAVNVCSFLAVPLLRGEAAVVVASAEHRAAFAAELARAGVDVPAVRADGRFVELDAARTLATFMTDDGPDGERFAAVVGTAVTALVRRFGTVSAYGEMVGLLAADGQLVAALQLEELWSACMRQASFRLLCGYPREAITGSSAQAVCSAHDVVVPVTEVSAAVDLPLHAGVGGVARRAVREICRGWGLHDREWVDDVTLVVSELVGNAVRHASSRVAMSLDVHDGQVTVSVTDGSVVLPAPRSGARSAEDGRGLAIIDALSARWGVERQPLGKRVWVELHPPAGCHEPTAAGSAG